MSDRPANPRVALIVSRYNASVTDRLEAGARGTYREGVGTDDAVETIYAPGAFELPQIAAAAARSGRFDAIVALGCLVRGETAHDRHIARAVAHGLTDVSVRWGLPVAFGVLTVETPEQAVARSGGAKGNKGSEAMLAALGALEAMRGLGDTVASGCRPMGTPCAPDKTGGAGVPIAPKGDATVASGFRPMGTPCAPGKASAADAHGVPIARKGDATGDATDKVAGWAR